jgi:hypothetical protein
MSIQPRVRASIDSVADWTVFGALSLLLIWSFVEIVLCLDRTKTFRALSALFLIVALPIAFAVAIKPLKPDESDANSSGLRPRRTLWALLLLNTATVMLAVLTAQTLKPTYDFQTPLLRFSAGLISQLWR